MCRVRMKNLVVVRSGGDLATGIIHRIWRAGFEVGVTEMPYPMAIRRTVSFAEAVYSNVTEHVHAVIETKRGHHLGRRVLYAPVSGLFRGCHQTLINNKCFNILAYNVLGVDSGE